MRNCVLKTFIFFSVILLLAGGQSLAQKYNWLRTYTPDNNNLKQFVEVSGNNVIVAGLFKGSINFGTTVLTNQNNVTSVFIANYDTNGVFQWAVKGGSDQSGEDINGLHIDEQGNIYIIGSFTFGPTTWGSLSLSIQGSTNSTFKTEAYVVKLNPNGVPQWIRGIYNTTNSISREALQKISIADSSIFILGKYTSSISVSNSSLTLNQASQPIIENTFISKFDLDGNLIQLEKIIDNSGSGISTITDLEAIDNSSYYLSGTFGQNFSFGSNNLTFSNPTSSFTFVIAKYTGANCDWLNSSTSSFSLFGGFNVRLEKSVSGDLWFAGAYSSDFNFLGNSFQLAIFGQPEWFYGKLSNSGALINVNTLPANSIDIQDIAENGSQSLLMAGSFSDSIVINGIKAFSNGSNDHLIVSVDSNNQVEWYQTGGGANLDFSYGIAADNSASAFALTNYQGLSQFGSTFLTAPFNRNASLLFKISECFNNQTPISFIGDTNLCEGESVRIVSNPISTSTFQWLKDGALLPGEVFRDLTVNIEGNYQVIVNGGGCSDTSNIISVSVDSVPNISLNLIDTVCQFDAPIVLSGGSPSGGIYSGRGVVSDSIFNPSIAGIGLSTISYAVSNGACSDSLSADIFVKPAPPVFFAPIPDICINASPITLNNALPVGGAYSGPGVSGNQFDPSQTNGGIIPLTYAFTDPAGCLSIATQNIKVDTFESASFSEIPDLCLNNGVYNLTEGSPAGGMYLGIGINGSNIDPLLTGPGTFNISYIATNQCGSDTSFQDVTVQAPPSVSLSEFNSICLNDAPISLNSGTPTGGVYSGTGVQNNFFDPAISGAGSFTIFYDYSDSLGCSARDSSLIIVNSLPNAVVSNDTAICFGDSIALSASGGLDYLWNTTDTASSITVSPLNSALYTVVITSDSNCSVTDSIQLNINPLPLPMIRGDSIICEGQTTNLTANGGQSYVWSTNDTLNSIIVSPLNSTLYSVITTDQNSCSSQASFSVTVNPNPLVQLFSFGSICINDAPLSLGSGIPAGGTYSGTGVLNNSFDPVIAGSGTFTIFYDLTDSLGCSGRDSSTIRVNALPNAIVSNDTAICIDEFVTLTASGGASYLWNTNDTTPFITVNPLISALYTVLVTSDSNCSVIDSIQIDINPLPTLNTSNDTTACIGDFVNLIASSDASNFLWSNMDTSASIQIDVSTDTSFSVLVTNSFGCSRLDSINITVLNAAPLFIGNDTLLAFAQSAMYDAGPGFLGYLWQDGSVNQSITINYDQTKAGSTDTISVIALNPNGCRSFDSALVTYDFFTQMDVHVKNQSYLLLYPNPSQGLITLEFDQLRHVHSVSIHNTQGVKMLEKIFNKDAGKINLDLKGFSSGVYYLEIHSDIGLITKKLMLE